MNKNNNNRQLSTAVELEEATTITTDTPDLVIGESTNDKKEELKEEQPEMLDTDDKPRQEVIQTDSAEDMLSIMLSDLD